jgi:hypothetical protein
MAIILVYHCYWNFEYIFYISWSQQTDTPFISLATKISYCPCKLSLSSQCFIKPATSWLWHDACSIKIWKLFTSLYVAQSLVVCVVFLVDQCLSFCLLFQSLFCCIFLQFTAYDYHFGLIWFDFWCFYATFSNISAISWRPVLVVKEAGVPGENHRPWASNW